MVNLICGALVLSVDSMVVSFALGACRLGRRQENRLAAAFGIFDGVASAIGILLGISLAGKIAGVGHWGGPALLAVYAMIVLATARMGKTLGESKTRRGTAMLYLLPLVMSVDNLAASFELARAGSPIASVLVLGIISGLASLFGFRAGEWVSKGAMRLRTAMGIRWDGLHLNGVALLMAAVVLAVF